MTLLFERGGPDADLGLADFRDGLSALMEAVGNPRRVLAIPPDHTRFDSRAGDLVAVLSELLGERLTDVMPALGTHHAMTETQLRSMFPGVPLDVFREHRWRTDVCDLGVVPSDFVAEATEGIYDQAWTAQVNRLLLEGNHDLIVSIGQVVPHEVIGMANYNKNIFVGVGGKKGIDHSHYLSALFGMERIMGRCDTPLRKILNYASEHFCNNLPIVYVLTVVEATLEGKKHVRGLFVGTGHDVFWRAGALSAQVNCFRIPKAPEVIVVDMDPKKYSTTWLANKAIYRCRMAIADGGTLYVIAPGVRAFGEDPIVDRLIRKHGYRTTPEILQAVQDDPELRSSLSAAAHLIHGSSENRFNITYATGGLSEEEIRSVGYSYERIESVTARYPIHNRSDGWNEGPLGESYYLIREPGLGLWMHDRHPHAF